MGVIVKLLCSVFVVLLFVAYNICTASETESECINGIVKIANNLSDKLEIGGKLFVYVREIDREKGPPTAVIAIESPNYPQAFLLCPDDQMIPDAASKPLINQYRIYARHSPTGTPMVKEGFLGTETGNDGLGIRAGESVEIEINKSL